MSAIDQGSDPRDELTAIWSLCRRARALGIEVEPVAALSSDEDHFGFGSMRALIMRGAGSVAERDLDQGDGGSGGGQEEA